jgi:hypothetical protein
VKLLLNTHVFLWLQTQPERLGERLALVQDRRTDLVVSAASAWEIGPSRFSLYITLIIERCKTDRPAARSPTRQNALQSRRRWTHFGQDHVAPIERQRIGRRLGQLQPLLAASAVARIIGRVWAGCELDERRR